MVGLKLPARSLRTGNDAEALIELPHCNAVCVARSFTFAKVSMQYYIQNLLFLVAVCMSSYRIGSS